MKLRNARNLEELVGIKVEAVDSGNRSVQNSDFLKFDPLHFRQKVPGMADRNFLVSQAILSSSSHVPKGSAVGNQTQS